MQPEEGSLSTPRRHGEDAMLLAEISRGRRDNRSLRDRKLATCLNRAANVVFADELQRRLTEVRLLSDCRTAAPANRRRPFTIARSTFRTHARSRPATIRWNCNTELRLIASGRQKLVDPVRQHASVDPCRRRRTRGRRWQTGGTFKV